MKEKFYKLGVTVGVTLILSPFLFMIVSLLMPVISYHKRLSSVLMNSGYVVLGFTLFISFMLNKNVSLQKHFWKVPAGILFSLLAFLNFLNFPKEIDILVFVMVIITFIAYLKYKKIL